MPRSLHIRALSRAAVAAAILLVPALTSAQSSPATPSTPAAQTPSLLQLQRDALRLTLIARLPAADRQEATKLIDRADALRQRERTLLRRELQAYVDALKAGTAPAEARTQAQQKVSAERTTLDKEIATLRTDARTFVQKVPQARALMRYLSVDARLARGGLGFGQGQGLAPQQRGYGRNGFGRGGNGPMGRQGERYAPWGMGPQSGWGQFGWTQPGWGRNDAPYGRFGYGMRPGMMSPRMPWAPNQSAPQQNAPQQNAPQNTTPPAGSGSGGT